MTIQRQVSPDSAVVNTMMENSNTKKSHKRTNSHGNTPAAIALASSLTNMKIAEQEEDSHSVSSAASHDGTATTAATLSPTVMYPSIRVEQQQHQPKSILTKTNSSKMVRNCNDSMIVVKQISKKRVHFGRTTISYHKMTIGDNPAVTRGVPIAIDWECVHTFVKPIPSNPSLDKTYSKNADVLLLSSLERARLLKDWGYTKMELAEAIYRTNKVRAQRQETADLEMAKLIKQQQQRQHNDSWNLGRAWKNLVGAFIKPSKQQVSNDAEATPSVSPLALQKM